MIIFREVLAALVYFAGLFCLLDALLSSFEVKLVVLALICFVMAYFIWPSERSKERRDTVIETLVEFLIEFPVEILKWLFRGVARLFGKGDGGFDVDI